MFNAYEVYNLTLTTALFCICRILILPFLQLYTKGVNDISYIDPWLPGLFAAFYLMHNGRASSANVISIAQRFEATKWRSILESGINVVVSLVLTYKLGIYGVLLGTIVALLYRTNDMILYAAGILKRSPWITYRRWGRNLLLFAAFQVLAHFLPMNIDSYLRFGLWGCGLSVIIIPVFLLVNSLLEPESARYAMTVVKNMLNHR